MLVAEDVMLIVLSDTSDAVKVNRVNAKDLIFEAKNIELLVLEAKAMASTTPVLLDTLISVTGGIRHSSHWGGESSLLM